MELRTAYLPESRYFRLQPLAGGIWAALAVGDAGVQSNAGIIDLGDHTLVFDTFGTPEAAQELRDAAEHLIGRSVAYVLNSHHHGDHILGNQVFADADIIATARTREGIAGAAAPPVHLPNVTFEQRMVFYGTHRSAEVVTYGGGHTESDAFLYLPGARIAFLGDLLSIATHPALWDGDPEEWVRILQQIEMLDLATVVPGHGPVGTAEDLALLRQYITTLTRLASEAVAGGKTADDAAARTIPPPFNTWQAAEVFPRNLRFLHERLARG